MGRMSPTELIALGLSILWLLACGVYFLVLPPAINTESGGFDSLRFMMTIMALLLPVAMIWIAAVAAQSSRMMRDESRRLQASVDGMRDVVLADRKERNQGGLNPEVEKTLQDIVRMTKHTENAVAQIAARPVTAVLADVSEEEPEDQPALALGTPAEALNPPLASIDLIRALNFPDSPDDKEGFSALRRTLEHRDPAQLVQASQDMLTLLSQDGIYMDDLQPEPSRAEFWRRFARGERGRAVSSLGAIRDRSSLALTASRMKEDQIFRDSAHHFLRKFDQLLNRFEPDATDNELLALAETRTARAFMLLGRASGVFT